MKKSIINKQAGFSLVELMVVVAIIGILAALSVGQVQKQIAKARQSEAKTNLSALYTAESTFRAEFATYCSDFGVIGLEYGGTLRYATGFSANGVDAAAAALAGYQGGAGNGFFNTVTACPAGGTPCAMIVSNGVTPVAPGAYAVLTASQFVAGAEAAIYDATVDVWSMTQDKILTNDTPGIP